MKKIKNEVFLERARKKFGSKFNYSNYVNTETKMDIECPIHGKFLMTPTSHLKSTHGCRECGYDSNGNKFRITVDEFIERANIKHNNYYDYSKVKEFKSGKDKVEIVCPKHGSFWQSVAHHINRGDVCPKCSEPNINKINKKRHDNIKNNFVNMAKEVHGDSFTYLESYVDYKTKLLIKCNKCGMEFKQIPYSHLSGNGCPKCRESRGEKRITRWLCENNIEFESQKWFKRCRGWSRPLPFDFWIKDKNLLIEFQGRQHYEPASFDSNKDINYMTNNLKNINMNDGIKKDYCKKNNIRLLEIPYWEFDNIENILKEELL